MAMDDDTDRYWMHSTASAKSSKRPAPRTTTSQDPKAPDRSNWIRKCAQQVLSSYRKDDFADADGYAVQLAMVLERYDDDVIRMVTSPITGIQRTCKFPPAIAEFVEFINEHIRRSTYTATYDSRSQQQIREREEYERQGTTEHAGYRKAVAERIKGELHAKGFQFEGNTKPAEWHWKQFTSEEVSMMYETKTE